MTENRSNSLDRAGTALLFAAKLQTRASGPGGTHQIDNTRYLALLAKVRHHLKQADPSIDLHKFAAAKTALEMLEASERNVDIFNAVDVFKGHVEAICGGPRKFNLGGKNISNKPTVEKSYLRAAAYVLWTHDINRVQLVVDAKVLLDLNRAQLRKFIYNSTYQSQNSLGMPQSSIWLHIPLVKELVIKHGYGTLTDFI
jgi:hypothetical protein